MSAAGMTPHERAARRLFASRCKKPVRLRRVVAVPDRGYWYDWADPETGQCGQCCMGAQGWRQAPLGMNPVVLMYRRSGWRLIAEMLP